MTAGVIKIPGKQPIWVSITAADRIYLAVFEMLEKLLTFFILPRFSLSFWRGFFVCTDTISTTG
ncbi:MAG: hypothetical protein EAZ19_14760 [Oscillatoriales cyanobacterium]|nr:MAG: hypothetical protein EAZ94_32620 [Oscillatoriales cyanobacterium]TAG94027.1 MAG: hypothetical protein EAZ19_14760 [Oscillatoriales cyanobacterium]